jgi:hypothetical protein
MSVWNHFHKYNIIFLWTFLNFWYCVTLKDKSIVTWSPNIATTFETDSTLKQFFVKLYLKNKQKWRKVKSTFKSGPINYSIVLSSWCSYLEECLLVLLFLPKICLKFSILANSLLKVFTWASFPKQHACDSSSTMEAGRCGKLSNGEIWKQTILDVEVFPLWK